MKRLFFLFLLAPLLLWPNLFFAQTAEKSYYLSDFSTYFTVNENSSVLVQEFETVNFTGSFSYITREIPYQGEMEIESLEVYDQKDQHLLTGDEIEIVDTGYSKQITINFSAVNEERTWLFQYKVRNVINYFTDYDELYWNVLPDDRDVPCDKVKAVVYLPNPVADTSSFQQKIYYGYYGSESEATTYRVVDNQTLLFEGVNVPAYYDFTIVAGWPKGIVEKPPKFAVNTNIAADVFIDGKDTYFQTPHEFWIGEDEIFSPGKHEIILSRFGYGTYTGEIDVVNKQAGELSVDLKIELWYRIAKYIIYLLIGLYFASPLFVGIFLLRRWFKLGRDPKGKGTIIPQYESYKNDPPGVVGTLIDEKADLKDLTSTIIDLAVRGYLKILEKEKNKYSFKKLKEWNSDATLHTYEKTLLSDIFGAKEEVSLNDLRYKFYSYIAPLRDMLHEEVLNHNYFARNPGKVRKKYTGFGVALIIFGFVGSFFFFIGIPLIVIGIMLAIFASRMPQKTMEGVLANEWAQGFKMFLFHAERYRIAKMTPEFFERCLPYAMVFGVEKEWANQFKDIYKQPPSWYEGYSTSHLAAWSVIGFTSGLSSSFSSAVQTTLTSMPRSSSSGGHWGGAAGGHSGFSGGGFSGGGFGGGGFRAG
ncbi:MAG: DUF2207 domain-containing protein [Patescibacteria group bacterium]|jgi:uncharacterized membrane protein YgcG